MNDFLYFQNLPQAELDIDLQRFVNIKLKRFVVPIYGFNHKRDPFVRGSGIIVFFEEEYYLVSAKHVFDQARRGGGVLLHSSLGNFDGVSGPQMLTGKGLELEESDQSDIGIVKLNHKVSKPPYLAYQGDRLIMDLDAIDEGFLQSSQTPREGILFSVLGYPETKNKFNHARRYMPSEMYGCSGRSPNVEAYDRLKVNERNNILFGFDRFLNLEKREAANVFPEPEGMSGGPIFNIYKDSREDDGFGFFLVGILTKQHPKERLMQGTDIFRVKDMMKSMKGLNFDHK
jgi:hypothetical protein